MKRIASIIIMLALLGSEARSQALLSVTQASHVACGNAYQPGTNDLTFQAWITLAGAATEIQHIVYAANPVSPRQSCGIVRPIGSNGVFGLIYPPQVDIYIPLPLGERHLVAFVRSGVTLSGYLDGRLYASKNGSGVINLTNQNQWYIGKWADSLTRYFNGTVEDARVYKRALSEAEYATIFSLPWSLADDLALVLRTCIVTNDTGTALTGVARNYGTGADGTYSNSPTVAQPHVQSEKPLTMELP